MECDGSGLVNLASAGTESGNRDPDSSQDGSKIVFASARDGSNEMQLFAMARMVHTSIESQTSRRAVALNLTGGL
jgi:Tol biopolymer transport system component